MPGKPNGQASKNNAFGLYLELMKSSLRQGCGSGSAPRRYKEQAFGHAAEHYNVGAIRVRKEKAGVLAVDAALVQARLQVH